MEEDIMELSESDVETTISSTTSDNGCFDCNICLQSVHEPVITLCGHIYCWPCIYKWLHIQDPQKTCPVCKADISLTLLVPLYAQGTSNSEDSESNRPHMGLEIPLRPPPFNINAILTSHPSQQLHQSPLPLPFQYHYQYHPHFSEGYGSNGLSNHGVAVMNSFFNPVTDMFREMGSTRMLVADGGYGSGNSRRMTRQEIWIVHNISVLSIFLLCFLICCLLLF